MAARLPGDTSSAFKVTIRFFPDDVQFSRVFSRFAEFARDLREPFDKMAEDFKDFEREQFAAQGAAAPWAPLSSRYAAWKARTYPGKTILRRTDRLYEAATGASAEFRKVSTPESLLLEVLTPYAIFHQTGTSAMPRRRVIDLTEAQKRRWYKRIHEHVVKARRDLATGLKSNATVNP